MKKQLLTTVTLISLGVFASASYAAHKTQVVADQKLDRSKMTELIKVSCASKHIDFQVISQTKGPTEGMIICLAKKDRG